MTWSSTRSPSFCGQPAQMLAVVAGDAAGQLDLDGHDAAIGALDDQVDLLAPARGPQMPDLCLAAAA